ncbi:Protein of unknown function [Pyronema omphalodes CBS 100304]|uniref:Uncharacterized protein n=1 Tax=Pyronema omphalodes (strain CBS 100304) TaxID=1076935 RepID=U4KZY9_PYROM|nr:Protein of unknown function [Pyronema omphalodes CBS 100304]
MPGTHRSVRGRQLRLPIRNFSSLQHDRLRRRKSSGMSGEWKPMSVPRIGASQMMPSFSEYRCSLDDGMQFDSNRW